MVRLLDESGAPAPGAELPPPDDLLDGYRRLVLARRFNEQASALARQGRLAVYPSSRGQEACQVVGARVLAARDWLFPTYRDSAAVAARGVDPVETLTLMHGDRHCGYDPGLHRVAPQATPLATHLLHAVGVGQAARMRGEDTVVLALCGDGATSEGDFHEACNFAAVFAAPVVFLVQNNKYAISVPMDRQCVAPSLAAKAVGYGMPGVLVDGNDLAALETVLGAAVRRARDGGGPTLVEADTYRLDPHTNADDPGRYRSAEEVETWLARDPLARLRNRLRGTGRLADADEERVHAEAERMATRLRAGFAETVPADPEDLFAHVYAVPTTQLIEQRALLRAELTAEEAS
ncbi:thiamine pyrophosphate-dependent enzyme [Pseudonocardia sp. HH130630-07]|uniref:thiamine pyrophosphate-dependent enzyme n=1 Tax=Pseudonocardia sp. HH130630-07 TaxID=1690815 RepID=UPI000814DDB0|nr:thiamine pyrophosphate-dependent enzyme [Pseudonocardia sp. HH130630-07]ANY10378.1 pyruvate dehydrogenase (acetyl-transferring) E1 component subunit alpha [Pseudonocardia sp. HH130630-07]